MLGFLALAAARPAAAETLSLLWDPSVSPNVAGYIVYVRIPSTTATAYDVGNATSFDFAAQSTGSSTTLPSPHTPLETWLERAQSKSPATRIWRRRLQTPEHKPRRQVPAPCCS